MSDEKPAYVYRASFTLPSGKRIFARWYGKKAFRIPVSSLHREDVKRKLLDD